MRQSITQGGRGGKTRETEVPLMETPPRVQQGRRSRPRAAMGGENGPRTRQQKQERGAGRRCKRQIIMGGGCGIIPGRRCNTMGEELGSGCQI